VVGLYSASTLRRELGYTYSIVFGILFYCVAKTPCHAEGRLVRQWAPLIFHVCVCRVL
jgi:hypothetical protein